MCLAPSRTERPGTRIYSPFLLLTVSSDYHCIMAPHVFVCVGTNNLNRPRLSFRMAGMLASRLGGALFVLLAQLTATVEADCTCQLGCNGDCSSCCPNGGSANECSIPWGCCTQGPPPPPPVFSRCQNNLCVPSTQWNGLPASKCNSTCGLDNQKYVKLSRLSALPATSLHSLCVCTCAPALVRSCGIGCLN